MPHDSGARSRAEVAHIRLIATGAYDGHVRVWNESREVRADVSRHTRPVKAVAWGPLPKDAAAGQQVLASGAQDEGVLVWRVAVGSGAAEPVARCVGHTASVESVAVNPAGDRVTWHAPRALWSARCQADACRACTTTVMARLS